MNQPVTRRKRVETLAAWFVGFAATRKAAALETMGISIPMQARIRRGVAQNRHKSGELHLGETVLQTLEGMRERSEARKRKRVFEGGKNAKKDVVKQPLKLGVQKRRRSRRADDRAEVQSVSKSPDGRRAKKKADDEPAAENGKQMVRKPRIPHNGARKKASGPINDILKEALANGILRRALKTGLPISGIEVIALLNEAHGEARKKYRCATISDEFLRDILRNN